MHILYLYLSIIHTSKFPGYFKDSRSLRHYRRWGPTKHRVSFGLSLFQTVKFIFICSLTPIEGIRNVPLTFTLPIVLAAVKPLNIIKKTAVCTADTSALSTVLKNNARL